MRCDVNVSVRPKGQAAFGTKVEIKNMNSFSNMQKAIEFEIDRQVCGAIEKSSMNHCIIHSVLPVPCPESFSSFCKVTHSCCEHGTCERHSLALGL